MWLFSFMHSCNIFLQTNSVQTLGPIHKSSVAINTGLWWAFLIQIGAPSLPSALWPGLPMQPFAPLPPLPLPTSQTEQNPWEWMWRQSREWRGPEATLRPWRGSVSSWYNAIRWQGTFCPYQKTCARLLPLSSRENLRKGQHLYTM